MSRITHDLYRRPLRALLLLGGCFLLTPLWAAEQRDLFRAAEHALQSGDRSVLLTAKESLRDYPLYPYLLYQDLRQRLADYPATEVRAFLTDYADLPLAPRLREAWLKQLAKQQRWPDVLRDFDALNTDAELDCLRRQALIHTGQTDQALLDMASVWMHGYSRPAACDPVLALWRKRGGLTQALIWDRFELSMAAGQTRLARYLRGLLHGQQQALADLWLAVHAKPGLVLDKNKFTALDQTTARIVIHGLKRWSRRNSVEAAAAFDLLYERIPPSTARDALQQRLALFVASRGDASALRRLLELPPNLIDEAVEEWRVRAALRQGDWQAVLRWSDAMRPASREQLPWRYWRARALEQTGQSKAAKELYRELATKRDYYGFLAADKAGLNYNFQHTSTLVDSSVLTQFKARPAALRMHELLALGRYPEARTEWQTFIKDADREQLRAAARLAHDWGWHDRVIVTLAQANEWNDLELRFPTPYRALVERYAQAERLPPAWVYAVMRKESIFQYDIRSGAGAIGLMQVMPATGRKIASDLQVPWKGVYTLLNTDANIRFGSYYLRAGLNRFQNSPMLATAAYNAGPGRVRSWLPDAATPADIWAELIPFSETRDYVKRVLEYVIVYQHRLELGTDLRLRDLMKL